MRIPGHRSLMKILRSAVPSPVSCVMAACAALAACGLYALGGIFAWIGVTAVAAKIHQYASTLEAMPIWVLIGTSLHQVATESIALTEQVKDMLRTWWAVPIDEDWS